MRILVVHNQLWAHYKSILFEEIQRVISDQYPDSEFLVAQIALYEKSRQNMGSEDTTPHYKYPYLVLFQKSLDSVSFGERLKALFRLYHDYRPDVLNITGYFDYAQILLLLYAKLRGVKTIISSESSVVDKTRSGFKESLKRLLLKQADAFFCFGTSSRRYLESLGVPREKIAVDKAAVVDNDQLLEIYQNTKAGLPKNVEPAFVYVGRLAPEKNLLRLVEAYVMLTEKNESLRWGLTLVGDGPERNNLETFVTENRLSRVTFTGGVGWKEVPQWLAKSSVLLLPSLSEPWGLVVNEAMLCGMPVIVSEKCGCAEDLVKNGKNGFIINPEELDSIIEAMQYYVENPEYLETHGIRSKEIIKPFSPGAVARQMAKAYHNLL